MSLKNLYLMLILLCAVQTVSAQLNFRIGYDLIRFSSQVNEDITTAFNEANPFLANSQTLGELHYLNGLNLGLSYKSKFSRFELGWKTASRSRNAFGEKPAMDGNPAVSFEKSMRYRLSGFYLSSEVLLNRIGLGASLSNDAIRLKSSIAGSSNDKIITNQTLYAFAPFVSYQLYQGKNISLVVQPYFKLYLRAINHTEIYTFLNLTDTIGLVDRPYSFGISFSFYNGQQR